MAEPNTLPALVARLASGRLGARAAVAAALAAAERERSELNAWVSIHHQRALAAAGDADAARAEGRPLAPLHGLPVAVKDNLDEAGLPCSAGSAAYRDRVPERDAAVVARLRRAGAVVVGRTNMDELADGVTSDNPHYGAVHNPWAPGFSPGGSSGGSAAAVAAGSVTAALGTDTGGSVRIPAALCGVVGLKPSRGLLPLDGVVSLSTTLDHVGVLAGSVAGVEALLAALAPAAVGAGPTALAGLRVGVLEGFAVEAEAGVGERFAEVLRLLERAGAGLTSLRLPGLADGTRLLARIYGPEAGAYHSAVLRQRPGDFGAAVRTDLERALGRDPAAYQAALRDADGFRRQLEAATSGLDLLLCPTTPRPAPPIGSPDAHLLLAFTSPFNLTGQPALSLPMGLVDGLPVGLQVVGRWGGDGALLAASFRLEEELGGPLRLRPPERG